MPVNFIMVTADNGVLVFSENWKEKSITYLQRAKTVEQDIS